MALHKAQQIGYPKSVIEKAKTIKLLICDVDGVLSNGKVYYSNQGDELKSFNIKDGLGIKQLLQNDIQVAIITGRRSQIVDHRAKELGIELIYQGNIDKQTAYNEIVARLEIKRNQVAHVGDDLPDLPLMIQSGIGFSVADGHPFVKKHADWITNNRGGNGAVREISDLLLSAQDRLKLIHESYLTQ